MAVAFLWPVIFSNILKIISPSLQSHSKILEYRFLLLDSEELSGSVDVAIDISRVILTFLSGQSFVSDSFCIDFARILLHDFSIIIFVSSAAINVLYCRYCNNLVY